MNATAVVVEPLYNGGAVVSLLGCPVGLVLPWWTVGRRSSTCADDEVRYVEPLPGHPPRPTTPMEMDHKVTNWLADLFDALPGLVISRPLPWEPPRADH